MTKKAKSITIIVVLVLLLAGGAYAYHSFSNNSAKSYRTPDGVSYAPPTKQEKADSEASKNSPPPSNTSTHKSSGSTTSKQNVDVTITTWSQNSQNLNVNGFASGVVEDGGTCTLKVTKDGTTVSAQRQAVANATNTSCGVTSIALSKLTPGTWSATLNYSSSTSTGTSSPVQITVK